METETTKDTRNVCEKLRNLPEDISGNTPPEYLKNFGSLLASRLEEAENCTPEIFQLAYAVVLKELQTGLNYKTQGPLLNPLAQEKSLDFTSLFLPIAREVFDEKFISQLVAINLATA